MGGSARFLSAAALVALSAGCFTTVHEGRVIQSAVRPGEAPAISASVPAVILLGDMHLPRFVQLPNTAYFVAVSRDRLRFHVELYHRWDTIADVGTWDAWLEDDDGTRLFPQAQESFSVEGINERLAFRGDNESLGPCRQGCAYWLSVYRGRGDLTFYRRDFAARDRRHLTLVMKRMGYEFRYRWSFVDSGGPQLGGLGADEISDLTRR